MPLSESPLSRRLVLGGAATAGATIALTAPAPAWAKPVKIDYPFTLGVASGDPEPTGVVLWTRLAPKPYDGGHGMRGLDEVRVRWEVAEDERMRRVVDRGQTSTYDLWAHSVHVEARGLEPGREYWYRFEAGGHLSPVGRTKTAPAAGQATARLSFASVSCQAYDFGFFTSYPHIVEDDSDFVMHLGDYVYEYGMSATAGNRGTQVPEVVQRAPRTLREWRATHALYKADPDLQAAHARLPFVTTWDDHEYINDYAGAAPDEFGGGPSVVRSAAYQAYWEHQPLRAAARFKSGEIRLYRRLAFGDLLQVDMLDGRQFRSVPPCGWGEAQACEAAYDPAITMLGTAQEQWLYAGLSGSGPRWNAFGNNVMIARLDHDGDLGDLLWNDAWDGFPAARTRLLDQVVQRQVRNPVFITGDWHSTFVNDIRQDFDVPDSPVVATEFVGTSISTNGDGIVYGPYYGPMVTFNPHIKYFDGDRRGYQRHTLTPDAWRTDLVMVDTVTRPTSRASVLRSFVVEDGRPGAVLA
ncbi:MAG: alkaline phosphatase D family protein [Nocardioides sp.]